MDEYVKAFEKKVLDEVDVIMILNSVNKYFPSMSVTTADALNQLSAYVFRDFFLTEFRQYFDETNVDMYNLRVAYSQKIAYKGPFKQRVTDLYHRYKAGCVIARAYRSYKLRYLLPLVAVRGVTNDMIKYRPGTGVEWERVRSFFENKEFMNL